MKAKIHILYLLLIFSSLTFAQTVEDSLTVVGIKWETTQIQKGIVRKHAQIMKLYNCVQNINIVEVDLNKRSYKSEIIVTIPYKITSEAAREQNAIAAINGSYFNEKKSNSVCFMKVGKEVIDTTTAHEFAFRVNGAVIERDGKLKIKPWTKADEKLKYSPDINILAAGPLMMNNGKVCNFSELDQKFIQTKHPRSAICITKNNKLLFITVDGRFPGQAEGINITELAHFIRILGGKYALNLDGGGSTTLWSNDAPENGVLNTPYDNKKFDHYGERSVANIIIVRESKK